MRLNLLKPKNFFSSILNNSHIIYVSHCNKVEQVCNDKIYKSEYFPCYHHTMKEQVVRANDYDIHLYQSGTGRPVVLLLGWMMHAEKFIFRKVLDLALKQHRSINLVIPHLPGVYKSGPLRSTLTIDDYTQTMDQLFKNIFKGEPVSLIGHSAGGRFALAYTLRYPTSVKDLVLMSSAGISQKPATKKRLSKAIYAFSAESIADNEHLQYYKETFRNIYDLALEDQLNKVMCKTLIIWGEKDKVIPLRKGERMHGLLPNSELKVFKGVGHMLTLQKQCWESAFEFIEEQYDR